MLKIDFTVFFFFFSLTIIQSILPPLLPRYLLRLEVLTFKTLDLMNKTKIADDRTVRNGLLCWLCVILFIYFCNKKAETKKKSVWGEGGVDGRHDIVIMACTSCRMEK